MKSDHHLQQVTRVVQLDCSSDKHFFFSFVIFDTFDMKPQAVNNKCLQKKAGGKM